MALKMQYRLSCLSCGAGRVNQTALRKGPYLLPLFPSANLRVQLFTPSS